MTDPRTTWIEEIILRIGDVDGQLTFRELADSGALAGLLRDAMAFADVHPILCDQLGRPIVPTTTGSTNQPVAERRGEDVAVEQIKARCLWGPERYIVRDDIDGHQISDSADGVVVVLASDHDATVQGLRDKLAAMEGGLLKPLETQYNDLLKQFYVIRTERDVLEQRVAELERSNADMAEQLETRDAYHDLTAKLAASEARIKELEAQ